MPRRTRAVGDLRRRSDARPRRRPRRFPATAVIAVVCLTLTACGAVNGTGTAVKGVVAGDVPASQLKLIGDGDTSFDRLARNALTDVEQFWKKVFPTVSGGKAFEPLRGGVYSVTTGHPDTANACMARSPQAADNNAFYCPADDSFAYDRSGLVGQLADHFGATMAMVVIAHEFGHLIQNRLDINRPSIYLESQADCAAGAFTAAEFGASSPSVQNPHFSELPPDLDRTIIGLILLRDSAPHSANDVGTHGTGFDRGSAFSDGFHNGVTFCYSDDWANRAFTERSYTSDDDYAKGGNLPLTQVLDPASGDLISDLNGYWKTAFTKVGGGRTWQPVQVKQADHVPCGDTSVEFGYCPNDNTVYYSNSIAQQVYNSVPEIHFSPSGALVFEENAPGDYALGTMIAVGFGMAVLHQSGKEITDGTALEKAVCYTGAYSDNINVPANEAPRKPRFVLSPPDMDEATYAILRSINEAPVFGSRNTTGLDRINFFRKGYLAKDPSAC
jgi:predicted metalloprotease